MSVVLHGAAAVAMLAMILSLLSATAIHFLDSSRVYTHIHLSNHLQILKYLFQVYFSYLE
jgi:hypothetical protein